MTTRHALTLLVASFLLAAGAPAQEQYPIGAHGARVELGTDWKRQTINPDLGDFQFVCRKRGGFLSSGHQAFFIVIEMESVLEDKADFESVFDGFVEQGAGTPITVKEGAGYTRATRRFDAEVNGIKVTFRLELLTRDGLSFLLMNWSGRSDASFLDQKVEEFLKGFRYPGKGSAFGRGTEPTPRTFFIGEHELSFSVRPFVLREGELEGDQLVNLMSPDDRHAIFCFLLEDMQSADATLEAALQACCDKPGEVAEQSRREHTVSGIAGRLMVARSASLTVHLLALPLGNGRFLDLRYVASGAQESRREDRDLFFRTLALTAAPTVLELPDPETPGQAPPLEGPLAAVFDHARQLCDIEQAGFASISPVGADRWLTVTWNGAVLLRRGQPPETLLRDGGWGLSVAPWGSHWLVANGEGVVRELRDGVLQEPLPFTARILSRLGDDLLCIRTESPREILGLGAAPAMGTDVLVRRTAAGGETVIARFADQQLDLLATDGAGRAAVAATRRPGPGSASFDTATRVYEVELAGGSTRELGTWTAVRQLAPADGGWLVTGQPADSPPGVYRVSGADTKPLLTGGAFYGVAAANGKLVFASDLTTTQSTSALHEVPLAAIAEVGPRCQPFSAQLLDEIGRQVLPLGDATAAPRSEQDLRRILADADRMATVRVGTGLPVTGPGVDALFEAVGYPGRGLGPHGRILLAILVTLANLEQGAVWVESENATWIHWLTSGAEVDHNAFAVTWSPANIVVRCLDDGEGMWSPGTSLHEQAEGRQLLLGTEPGALRARVAAAVPADFDQALSAVTHEPILGLLAKQPENAFVRQLVYRHLAGRGLLRAVEQIAADFAGRPDADPVDLRAWIAAWLDRVDDPKAAMELAHKATELVRSHPADAELCCLLGAAYEKARPSEPAFARTCYRRVLALQQWGSIAQRAEQALERLGQR